MWKGEEVQITIQDMPWTQYEQTEMNMTTTECESRERERSSDDSRYNTTKKYEENWKTQCEVKCEVFSKWIYTT